LHFLRLFHVESMDLMTDVWAGYGFGKQFEFLTVN
jgi:hypothetical protein